MTREEILKLFDYVDNQVEAALRAGRKGALAAYRDATILKTIYGVWPSLPRSLRPGRDGLLPQRPDNGIKEDKTVALADLDEMAGRPRRSDKQVPPQPPGAAAGSAELPSIRLSHGPRSGCLHHGPCTPDLTITPAATVRSRTAIAVGLRRVFVQRPPGEDPRHGPLKEFVANGDERGARAYLITVAANSQVNEDGWTTELDSLVWARLFDAHLYTADEQGARTTAWRILNRLADRNLVKLTRARGSRKISVTLLREDGSGDDYTRPGIADKDAYLRLPVTFWTKGYDAKVGLPGLAMLLVVAAEKPWHAFPAERMDEWYGWSADTTLRGLKKLVALDLVERREVFKEAPLTPTGSTKFYQYRLARWMRPKAQPRPEASAA